MNILYTFNDKFVPQVAAAITSVCENNKNVFEIHFYPVSYTHSPSPRDGLLSRMPSSA